MRRRFSEFLFPFALLASVCFVARADEAAVPKHLTAALTLLKNIDLEHTGYEHGEGRVVWSGACESHADCSGFVSALFKQAYGYDDVQFKKWFGTARPLAARYHDTILKHAGFAEVTRAGDILPGDILAIKYTEPRDDKNTGHVMVVAGAVRKMESKAPLKDDTIQWEVPVVDSSSSGHGLTDWRHGKGKDGKDHDGLGAGVFRIYTDSDGKVAGYTWSVLAGSHFVGQAEHHLAIGRLEPNYQP